MTVGDFMNNAATTLRDAGIETARLEVLILLEDALERNRSLILAHPEAEIPDSTEVELNNKIMQRATNLPLAYIRGKAAFYGREFIVQESVLVPRPETEAMIELLKDLPARPDPLRIADVGAGSGCLGITAALEFPGSQVDLYDIDASALGVATHNAKNHTVHVGSFQEDLLQHAAQRHYDILLANLPYVPLDHPINEAAKHEPALAIFSGKDGLDAYRHFWKQVAALKWQPSYILTESLMPQHTSLKNLAEAAGYRLVQTKDLVQLFSPAN